MLRLGHEADVLGLDPVVDNDDVTLSVLANVDEALVALDREGTLRPALATSWTSPDDATWVFELRPGVRFHDGRPFTSADAVAALERARADPASKVRGYVSSVAAIEAPSPRTLKLRTRTHDPLLLNRLASIPIYRAGGGTNIGTGPYRVRSWTRGSRLEMESFAGYWGGPPAIPRVDFVPLRDEARVVDALSKGEVDVARAITNGAATRLASARGLALVSRGGLWNRFLFVEATPASGGARNPLADVRVRHAVSLAIDRAALARRVGGGAMPAGQLPPPGVFGYQPGLEEPARNVAEARRLLADAGFPNGCETQLLYAPALANAISAQEIERMLAEAGIRVKRQAMPREELIPRWQSGRLPLFLGGWLFDSLDASSFLRDCVATRDPARGTGTFNAGFSSPALDRLIEENASLPGRDARVAQYPVLMKAVLEEMPIVPLFTEGSLFAVSDRVAFEPRLDGRLLAFEVRWKEPR